MATEHGPAPLTLVKPGSGKILLRALGYLKPYWRLTLGAYITLMCTTALALIIPQLIRRTIDFGIRAGDLALLKTTVFAILGVTLVRGVLTFVMGRCTEVASQGVVYDLRNALYHKLSALSFSYHDRAQIG